MIVRIIGAAQGGQTFHDGRYVVAWDPHTDFGVCALTTAAHPAQARRFADAGEVHSEWTAISRVQPIRPDGLPNRPLSGLSIEILNDGDRG